MKLICQLFYFLILTSLFSCGSNQTNIRSAATNPHEQEHQKMHDELAREEMEKVAKNQEIYGLQKILLEKQAEGIHFYAIGNEPSWFLDMDFEKTIHFNTMSGIDFVTPAVDAVMGQDHNVKRYHSVTESGEIIVQIIQGECMDNMSGEKFAYEVTVDYKTSKETTFNSFKGCGMYVPDFRLHDIWAVEEVFGVKINPMDFNQNAPRLEIFVSEQRVFGHDGCNTFRGKFYNEQDKLFFGPMASTKMACIDNEEITLRINEVFAKSILKYQIENNRVHLFENGEKIMILKHID